MVLAPNKCPSAYQVSIREMCTWQSSYLAAWYPECDLTNRFQGVLEATEVEVLEVEGESKCKRSPL